MPARELLSIGDLSELSGITIDTIRVWERRYGRPQPMRLPSGHRRYQRETAVWLRQVAEALSLGHRPGKIVPLPDEELTALLEAACDPPQDPREVKRCLELVESFEEEALRNRISSVFATHGPKYAIAEVVAPLVNAVGRCWVEGTLEIRHEHFLSEILEDLLRNVRRNLEVEADGPLILMATLPGENHGLGLQMAAIHAVLGGARPRILGTETPIEEILDAVRETGAVAVAMSISLATGGPETDRKLGELRQRLPRHVSCIAGGRGARGPRRGPRGVTYAPSFDKLTTWINERVSS